MSARFAADAAADSLAISGVHDLLEGLCLPKAIASGSTPGDLDRKLRRVGLFDIFAPHIYSSEHVARAKPAPDIFLHAARNLGVAPADCLVIEDSVNGVKVIKLVLTGDQWLDPGTLRINRLYRPQ